MKRLFWALLVTLLLQGCSAIKLGYNQAPQLAYWWLDSQMSFEGPQSGQVREALEQLQRWHRERELLVYADLLQKVQTLSTGDVEPQQVCEVWTQADEAIQRLMAQSIRLAAPVAMQLQPSQVRHLARRWEEKNEDWEKDWLQGNAQERLKRRLERTQSRYADFYGSLSEAQTQLLRTQLGQSVWTAEFGRRERLRRQQLLLQALKRVQASGTTVAQAEAALQGVWQQWLVPGTAADQPLYRRMVTQSCQNLAELHNTTSAEQRQRAVRRLRAYERDLRELSGRP